MTGLMATRRQLLAAGAGFAASAFATSARAAFPDRPIRWMVGFPPGGATDLLARMIGQPMSVRLGQPVVVDNRPGAGSSVAAEALARSAPDGYTVMGATSGTLIINPVIYRSLGYEPERDFRPVGLYADVHLLLAVRADSPLRTVAEYLDRARASSEPVQYGSSGTGTPLHLAMERLAREAQVRLDHVPYRGMGPALTDLLAGFVGSIVVDYATAASMVRAGRIRPLGTFSGERLAALPELPTIAEQGLPGFAAGAWQGVIVPRATPDPIVERLSGALSEALAEPSVRARYAELGLGVLPSDPASFTRLWQSDREIWQPLIRSLNITVEG